MQVRAELTFEGELSELENDLNFKNGIKAQISDYADIPESSVTIERMRSGSVIVEVAIVFPESRSDDDILEFVSDLEEDSSQIFSDPGFVRNYGVPTVDITDTDNLPPIPNRSPSPPVKEDDGSSGVNIGVVVGATIGSVAGLAILIVGIWMCCKKSRYAEPQQGGYEPA